MVMIHPLGLVVTRRATHARAHTSMIGLSCCYHVTLLILLLGLRLAFASGGSPLSSSSTSSSSSSSLSSSSTTPPPPPLSPSYSPPSPFWSSSSPLSSTLSFLPESFMSSAPPSSSSLPSSNVQSQSEGSSILSNSESDSEKQDASSLSANQNTDSNAMEMPGAVSSNQHEALTTTQSTDISITKRAKFKLGASEKEKKLLNAVEKLFLKHVGLQQRPRINKKFKVPEYMLDLYRTQVENSKRPNTYLKLKGTGLIAANTVRSFLHTDSVHSRCQPPLCSRVFFDVSTIADAETVTGAELRIFTEVDLDRENGGGLASGPGVTASHSGPSGGLARTQPGVSAGTAPQHRIEVHEIVRPASGNGEAISRLLDTRVVKLTNSSWHSFDIHPAVLKWKRGKSGNHGLEVRVVSQRPVLSTEKHVRVRRSAQLAESDWAIQRPVLVVYTDDGTSPDSYSKPSSGSPTSYSSSSSSSTKTKLPRRKRRSAGDEKSKNKKKNKKDRKRNRRKNRKRRKKKKSRKRNGPKNICKRHGLYVDFNDVGWDDWIVAPAGYNAYYCGGNCMAPLPHFAKASNHAMLQARVYKVNPSAVPMVCCVPIKMSPIPMLYMDEKGRTVLKNYQDMAVEECGCK
ncbi:bone morphogenetic protein 2 isoform X1 [Aplysia californica]|uniref:Bone morphogenetic protein 2 isoform X1 n=2 Tax=Aplysia californica TaxID=6500 RepID=A0ABM0K945_APLCA|nr:bone morphogenetic protein 2 isoform X1 [Aplysia californica]